MKVVLLLIAIVAISSAAEARSSSTVRLASLHTRWHELEAVGYGFEHYKAEWGREYASPQEEAARKAIFESNLEKILAHNRQTSTWKAGVNHLTDRTESELKALRGYKRTLNWHPDVVARRSRLAAPVPRHLREMRAADLPASVDWRTKGAVTPVKDQGQCGSCWTFASTSTIESAWFLKTGVLQDLSEQQIASCTPNPQDCGGSGGCEGGTAEVAFQGVIDYGGHASGWLYPYLSWNGTDYMCRLNGSDPTFQFSPSAMLSSYVALPTNDQNALLAAIATIGPIAISVDASSWHLYESGVFSGCNMQSPDIDHNVQLVGYGTDKNLGDYWLVRNSWTVHFGESGYIRVARPSTPMCGVDTTPCDGSACHPCPPSQTVCGMCGILSDSSYPIPSTSRR